MYTQVNLEENDILLMNFMVDYRLNDHVLTIQYHNILDKGRPSLRQSTVGWSIFVQCKYGSTSWENLSDRK